MVFLIEYTTKRKCNKGSKELPEMNQIPGMLDFCSSCVKKIRISLKTVEGSSDKLFEHLSTTDCDKFKVKKDGVPFILIINVFLPA